MKPSFELLSTTATENMYTQTPHAYGSAIPFSARKIKIPPQWGKQPSFQGLYSYVLYFIPDKASCYGTRVKTISKAICFRTDASIAFV